MECTRPLGSYDTSPPPPAAPFASVISAHGPAARMQRRGEPSAKGGSGRGRTALVTGSQGFIGSYLCAELLGRGTLWSASTTTQSTAP